MKANLVTKRYIVCPHCNQTTKSSADHLIAENKFPNSFGPWSCDHCGQEFKGILNEDLTIDIEKVIDGNKYLPTMDLLVILPQTEPIFFLKRGQHHFKPNETLDDVKDNFRYYYNECSCPTNWMGDFETICIGDDADPHGVVRFVDAIMPGDYRSIVAEVKSKYGLNASSNRSDASYEILTTAFPEATKRIDQLTLEAAEDDWSPEPEPGMKLVSIRVAPVRIGVDGTDMLQEAVDKSTSHYGVYTLRENGEALLVAKIQSLKLAILVGQFLSREEKVPIEKTAFIKAHL